MPKDGTKSSKKPEMTVKEQEYAEEVAQQDYLEQLQWEENMNSLYEWDEGGFCDGFTRI